MALHTWSSIDSMNKGNIHLYMGWTQLSYQYLDADIWLGKHPIYHINSMLMDKLIQICKLSVENR